MLHLSTSEYESYKNRPKKKTKNPKTTAATTKKPTTNQASIVAHNCVDISICQLGVTQNSWFKKCLGLQQKCLQALELSCIFRNT